jgi:hypothetical protein
MNFILIIDLFLNFYKNIDPPVDVTSRLAKLYHLKRQNAASLVCWKQA